MFKKKEEIKEMPLGYWEESSYMLVIPENANMGLLEGVFERVANLENVKIIEKNPLTPTKNGSIKLNYENEKYEVGFYPTAFSIPEFYIGKNYYLEKEEIEKIKKAENALTIFMKWNENAKKSYHLQLKIAVAMIPDFIGIVDESAEKILPKKWVKMISNSKILPSANDLYTVQAVSDKSGEVWMHTHGLARCKLTELEILKSDKENYNSHYHLLTTFASYLVDKKKEYKESAYIGVLQNKEPVVATYISWTEGIKKYKHLKLGNEKDRKMGHNSKTSIIFLYKSEEDEKHKKFTKVSEQNHLWKENPIFFLSDEETNRMKSLAIERIRFVKEASKEKENKIHIKIGLMTDNKNDLEHIWFELIEWKKDKLKARLLQEPYNVKNMHVNDEAWYTISDITDWIIYTKTSTITPDLSYLLDK